MKKTLLSAAVLITALSTQAQTYYPSGSSSAPTWGYENVINNGGEFFNGTTGKASDAIRDAFFDFPNFSGDDAYDDAFSLFINKEDSTYTESGTVDTTGTLMTLKEQLIDSFYVSKSYFFSPTEAVIRAVFKIRNPSTAAKSVKIGVFTNLGSDNDTKLVSSSTSGTVLANADRWMVTSDDYGNGNTDPINTFVRFGPGTVASMPAFGKKPENGYDDFSDTISTIIPANSYKLVMQINRLDSTELAAVTNAATFNDVATIKAKGYLTGMSNNDLLNTVNWDFSSITCNTVSVNNPQSICAGGVYVFNTHTYTVTGNYNDTLQTTRGCDSVIVTQLTVNALPTITVNSGAICAGQNFTITPNGATSYTYSSGNSVVTPTTNTTYTVIGADANGCKNTAVMSITVNAMPTLTATSSNSALCSGQTASLTASGSVTSYTWSTNAATAVIAVTPTTNTTYTVVGTDANGCKNTAVTSVTVNTLPTLTATSSNSVLCSGQTASLTATGSITSYTWSTNATTAVIVITPTTSTTYTVMGTDANGCVNTTTVNQTVSVCTGISSLNGTQLSIYPNPTNGAFTVDINSAFEISISNALGQIIEIKTLNAGKHSLDIKNQMAGIYFVKISANNKHSVIKLIKE